MTAVPVIAAAHSTTFAASAGGGLGRDERGGADGGESGRSENRLADHGCSPCLWGCARTSCQSVGRTIRGVQRRSAKSAARAAGTRGDRRPRLLPAAGVAPCRATARSL